jgi:hypothetical protein
MKKQNLKKLFLTCLASTSLLSLSSCETTDGDHDDDDHDHHHRNRGTTTTTTVEETTLRRSPYIAPSTTTTETQTIRAY